MPKITKSNMTIQKTKELDRFLDWLYDQYCREDIDFLDNEHIKLVKRHLKSLLTQQRTELEQQKVKVVWNDVCEQIKKEARTELLEEIKKLELKHSINPNSPSRERKIIYNEAIKDVINLMEK